MKIKIATAEFSLIPSIGRYTHYKTYYPPANRKAIDRGYRIQWLSFAIYLPIYHWFRKSK